MGSPTALAIVLGLFAILGPHGGDAYRLNVPRVLLPYHPTNPVSFLLEVTDPEGGCFSWRSTRPEIVAVHTVDPHPSGCSSRAVVTAVSKHAEEHSAVVFAQDTHTGSSLSCGVTVDVIKSVSITTTTRILHIDAAPAKMIVEAFNHEGDRFSNLGDIPFDWSFTGSDNRPLRIVPFSQSTYEVPEGIQKLELAKKKGFVILVEGHSTGSAKLTARLAEGYFENVKGNAIDLVVVANLILVPSSDVYIVPHSSVQYGIQLIKSGRVESIELPHPQYYLQLSDQKICSLQNQNSVVVAGKVGHTEISLIDKNIEGKFGIKPQSAHIYVVEPDTIEFTIDRGNSWYLERGATYTVSVRILDQLGNSILIPESATFATAFSSEHFEIVERSKNGTWFTVKAKSSGKTIISSSFLSVLGFDGKEYKFSQKVSGQRSVQISEPIELTPKQLIFPLASKRSHSYKFSATGGTGAYIWSSTNTQTARVDEMNGSITPYSYGTTAIEVRDGRNSLHKAEAVVYVLEPARIKFAPSPVEAEVGRLLTLNIEIAGLMASGQYVSFSDCRSIELRYQVDDSSVFAVESNVDNESPEDGYGCTTVVLRALSSGDTKLTVFVDKHSATVDISAYLPLNFNQPHSKSSDFLLALGSDITVGHSGGPRPWLLDGSNFFATMTTDSDLLEIAHNQGSYQVFCGDRSGHATLKLTVGNRRTASNQFPAVAVAEQIVCCSKPSRVSLAVLKERLADSSSRSCPVTSHLINSKADTQLEFSLFGKCEDSSAKSDDRRFDSVSSVALKWSVDNEKFVSIQDIALTTEHQGKLFAVAKPKGLRGQAHIQVDVDGFKSHRSRSASIVSFEGKVLKDSIMLGFVDRPEADSSSIVLFNEPTVTGNVKVKGGSGYFMIAPGYLQSVLEPNLASQKETSLLEISPRGTGKANVTIYDLCIRADPVVVEVEVTNLYDIAIAAPNLFVHNNQFTTKLALTSEPQTTSTGARLSDVHIHIDGCKDSILDVLPFIDASETEGASNKQRIHYEISLTALSPTVWNDCSITVKNALSNRVFKVPVKIKLYSDASTAQKVGVDATVAVEYALSHIERAFTFFKDFSALLVALVIGVLFLYLGRQNQLKMAKIWEGGPLHDRTQNSMASADSLANGSQQWVTTHKPLYSSTPGDGSFSRRFTQHGYEEQSSLERSGLLSSGSARKLAGSDNEHFLWSTGESLPKMRNMGARPS